MADDNETPRKIKDVDQAEVARQMSQAFGGLRTPSGAKPTGRKKRSDESYEEYLKAAMKEGWEPQQE